MLYFQAFLPNLLGRTRKLILKKPNKQTNKKKQFAGLTKKLEMFPM